MKCIAINNSDFSKENKNFLKKNLPYQNKRPTKSSDYFLENRLQNNENSFLNAKKALKLENEDVVTFCKSLIYDKRNGFECLLLEIKVDKNHYLAHNQVEESFSSTIFTKKYQRFK